MYLVNNIDQIHQLLKEPEQNNILIRIWVKPNSNLQNRLLTCEVPCRTWPIHTSVITPNTIGLGAWI